MTTRPSAEDLKKVKYVQSIRNNWLKLNRIFNPSVPAILPPPTNPELNSPPPVYALYPDPSPLVYSSYSQYPQQPLQPQQPPVTIINNNIPQQQPPVTIINNNNNSSPNPMAAIPLVILNESIKPKKTKKEAKKKEETEEKKDDDGWRIILGIIGFIGIPITAYLLGSNYSRWKIAKELNKDCTTAKKYRLTNEERDLVHLNSKQRKSIQSHQARMLVSKSVMCGTFIAMFAGSYFKQSNLRNWSAFAAFSTVCVQLFEYTRYKVMSEKEDHEAVSHMSYKANTYPSQ